MADESQEGRSLTPGQVAGGVLAGHDKALEMVGDHMLTSVRPMTRFALKRLPGVGTVVFNLGEFAGAPNKTRAAFGIAGSLLGGAGGAALGGAAGGINAPLGAALGSAFGEDLGEQVYDENANAIDGVVDPAVRSVRKGLGTAEDWMAHRWRQVTGAHR